MNKIMGILFLFIFFVVYVYGAVKLAIFMFSFGELIGIISSCVILFIMIFIGTLFEKYFD